MAKVLSKPATDPEAAVVSLEPGTGNVRALVGGRDFFGGGSQAKFNLATQGQRPAGSAFKPFVLAAAVHQGISLHKLYSAPQTLDLPLPRGGVWHVRNFEDEMVRVQLGEEVRELGQPGHDRPVAPAVADKVFLPVIDHVGQSRSPASSRTSARYRRRLLPRPGTWRVGWQLCPRRHPPH